MTPDQASANIAELAQRAYEDLLRRIRAGETPRAAADAALAAFRGPYYQQVADTLSVILKASLGPAVVKAWPVGNVKLSQALYAHHRAISAATAATVNAHLQGLHSARDLAKTLYEGYDFKPDTLKVVAKLPKYLRVKFDQAKAATLKTPALRAAYLQAVQAAEAGAGQAQLEQVLKVAFYERNRYLANRIARTEIARAQNAQIARELLADDQIGFVQIRLSSKHPKPDICDLHAQLDAYGLGPGVYPKAEAPLPPFHPHCYCQQRPILSIPPTQKVQAQPNAARAFLKGLPPDEARQVMGGRERLRRVLEDGDSVESVVNTNVDPLYHARRMGEVGQPVAMPSPQLPNPIEQRVADAAQRYTKQLESLPFDDAITLARQAVNDPLFRRFFEEGLAGNFPVGVLRPEDMKEMGTKARTVLLSARSLKEHLEKHPEIQLQDYQKIPLILDQGEVWQAPGKPERLIYLFVDGVTYRAALKRTLAGDENYFLTLFKNTKKKPPKGAVRVR